MRYVPILILICAAIFFWGAFKAAIRTCPVNLTVSQEQPVRSYGLNAGDWP